jgi:uncharacterized membrane protein YdjX (TVP38/TMEM64 family)
MRIFNNSWFKLSIFLVYLGLAYFILWFYHIDYTRLKDIDPHLIKEKVEALGIWIPLIYVLFYILRPLILFPATILSILGGVIFGYFWGIILVLIGAMLSAVTEFLLSRYFVRKSIMALLNDDRLFNLDSVVRKHGFKTVLLIRLIPNVAFDIQNFSLGLSGVKFKEYLLGTFLGIIPANFIYVYLGYSCLKIKYLWKTVVILSILLIFYFSSKKLVNLNKSR